MNLPPLAPKAVVGACMHRLAMLIYGVLRSGQPFDVDFEKKKACVSRRYLTLNSLFPPISPGYDVNTALGIGISNPNCFLYCIR
jgi:hypothetical protein